MALNFISSLLISFAKENGSVSHKIVVGIPLQNALSERKSRIILERIRCMLSYSSLYKSFWVDAMKITSHLINKCPYSALDFNILEQVWFDHPISYWNLKTFGCITYFHNRENTLQPRFENVFS